MDGLFSSFPFLAMGWDWTKVGPPVHIYYSTLWEDNFIPLIYNIWDHFVGVVYHKGFKQDAPTFSAQAKALISTMGDWYVGKYFSYIGIWDSNIFHLLPIIIPNRMVLEEISFQTVVDGVFPKKTGVKRKVCPKFPLNLGSLVIQN